jgi:hypothetical protein
MRCREANFYLSFASSVPRPRAVDFFAATTVLEALAATFALFLAI